MKKSLLLLVAFLTVAWFVCAKELRPASARVYLKCPAWPQCLLPNDTVIAWGPANGPVKSKMISIHNGKITDACTFCTDAGPFNIRPVSDSSFAYETATRLDGNVRSTIHLWGGKAGVARIVTKGRLWHVSRAGSPHGDKLLVEAQGADTGLMIISLRDGKRSRIEIGDCYVMDAVYTNHDSILYIVSDRKSVTAHSVKPEHPHDDHAIRLPEDIDEIRCSPDGAHIAYIKGNTVESMKVEDGSTVALMKVPSDRSKFFTELIWSNDGSSIAVWIPTADRSEITLCNIENRKSQRFKLDKPEWVFRPFGWLSNNREFLIRAVNPPEGKLELWSVGGTDK